MAPTHIAHTKALEGLRKLQKDDLSIIRLAEPVSLNDPANGAKRNSDASADASDSATPPSFAADLSHYKELFSKLRFSYLEQVTKEKFLRAIVGDPPFIVEHQENVELEAQLAVAKSDLKAQKEEVAMMTADLEASGRDLSRRYEQVQLQTAQLSTLPLEIIAFEETLSTLHEQKGEQAAHPALSLPLPATAELLAAHESDLELLDRQLCNLQSAVPKKARELERLENELRTLEVQKTAAVLTAREAMRRKEDGERGVGDDLEMRGRWYRSTGVCLREVLVTEA